MAGLDIEAVLQRVEEVTRDVIAPSAVKVDCDAIWPKKGMDALQDAGLGGMVIKEAQGGLGHGLYALARVCETIGSVCASTAMCYGMHSVGAAVISARATEYHQDKYLGPINQGDHITSLALSEAGSGAHFYLPQTEISKGEADTFLVNGEKTFITNGSKADSYVVSVASQGRHDEPGEFSLLMLDGDEPGLQWGPEWRGFGMRGNSSRSLEIKDIRVSTNALLGREGDQTWYVFNVVAPYFLTAMSGAYLGIATSSLKAVQAHLLRRRHVMSGKNLASQQVLQHRLGVLWSQVERTRQLLYHASRQGDIPGNDAAVPLLLSAKAEVAECAVHVANEAMTLMGGMAYRDGDMLQRNLRDARAAHVMAPTTDILRTWTGRLILGLPLLAE